MRHVKYGLAAAMLSTFWLGLVLFALHLPERRAEIGSQFKSGVTSRPVHHHSGVEKFAAYQTLLVSSQ